MKSCKYLIIISKNVWRCKLGLGGCCVFCQSYKRKQIRKGKAETLYNSKQNNKYIIMTPSIGRMVVYHCDKDEKEKMNNNQETAPAIITAVWGDECVNLKVILDGENNLWKTSAPLGELETQWSWPVIK